MRQHSCINRKATGTWTRISGAAPMGTGCISTQAVRGRRGTLCVLCGRLPGNTVRVMIVRKSAAQLWVELTNASKSWPVCPSPTGYGFYWFDDVLAHSSPIPLFSYVVLYFWSNTAIFGPNAYRSFRVLRGFHDSINCLAFNTDGSRLAAGGDDGRVIIYDLVNREDTDCSEESCPVLLTLISPIPVSALLWHGDVVYVGLINGSILEYSLEHTQEEGVRVAEIPTGLSKPVESLDVHPSSGCLATISDSSVIICSILDDSDEVHIRTLADPPSITRVSHDGSTEATVSPRSANFSLDGRCIFVSYLAYGIVGYCAVAPDEKSVVVSNLFNGFDRYCTRTFALLQNYLTDVTVNVTLPCLFIHDGDALLLGTSCGKVTIVDTTTTVARDLLLHGARYGFAPQSIPGFLFGILGIILAISMHSSISASLLGALLRSQLQLRSILVDPCESILTRILPLDMGRHVVVIGKHAVQKVLRALLDALDPDVGV
ncbi:hypothetical protein CERSUDRAFT_73780 [Gelatoporia subvermispora B]|uniref:Uncharacterized protein n=1 Tax=Ceriporiopsis subvermispora (strain B) TaxID=914234 RepID=M2PKA6_CERS8|nr:hypothetical protein CERSUDRAFT_73780 [Gelatoporia subvermispora B]